MSKQKYQPINMIVPNGDFIYAPSRLRGPEELSANYEATLNESMIKVSFESDGISNPKVTSVFSSGLFRYIRI